MSDLNRNQEIST